MEDDAFGSLCNLSVLILTANPLQFVGLGAFHGLTSLLKLVAVETSISSLDSLPIANLTSLQELNLSHNLIASLKLPSFFSRFLFLQSLRLQENKISSIFIGDLDALSSRNLTLELSRNDITFIQPDSFAGVRLQELSLRACFESSASMQAGLWNLSGLHVNKLVLGNYRNIQKLQTFSKPLLDGLCHVHFQEVTLICVKALSDTGSLSACLNNISTVRLLDTDLKFFSDFPRNSRVRHLEISDCPLRQIPALQLSNLEELRVIRITHNRNLADCDDFEGLPNLETLDLSHNKLRCGISWENLMNGTPNLKRLDLSVNLEIKLPPELFGPRKLEYLDLQRTRLEGPGKVPVFLGLANLLYLDISYTDIHIETECPFCGMDRLQVLRMGGNTFEGNQLGNSFKNITQLQVLDISNCGLQQVSPDSLAGLPRLRELNVSNNKLLGLHPVIYECLQALTVLDLHNNQLATLTEEDLKNLPRSLRYLDLSQNLFDCSCGHISFLRWAKEHRDLLQYADGMLCHNPVDLKNSILVNFDLSFCQVSMTTVAVSVVVSLAVVVCLILVYKYYFHLYYMVILLSRDRSSTKKDNTYDAFVIYSSEDQEWVTQELEETLETGIPRFRLCLFYRDFIPGVSIMTNIIKEGFQSSRKVVAVVSAHFLESRWCNFELEIAQSWQLLDSQASLVLIVLEGVDQRAVQRKLGLFRYLRRNTYLVWKDRELNRHLFLRQLRLALLDGKTWTEEELKLMLKD
ncbi:toll-like receptor 4 isoform X1 [Hemicordylus capensis]|nr:toll-like receptor 4 isoform X1 [Hemicordylus capensis]